MMNLFGNSATAFLSWLIVFFFISGNAFSETKKVYYDSGKLKAEYEWSDGQMNGQYLTYYENGELKSSGNYKNGKQIGVWNNYNENGDVYVGFLFELYQKYLTPLLPDMRKVTRKRTKKAA